MPSRSVSQSLNALPPGTVLRDYVIESELGSGGFSIVYLARHHLKSDWLYAIKEFLPAELAARARDGTGVRPLNTEAQSAFADGLRRFRDEAEQLRKFRNERYIVSCLNYFEENDTAYLVMDYDDGLPLSEFLRRREAAGQPFTEADLLAVVEPLLEGLTVVHRAGVLHRDIKPGNIFVRRQDDITGRPAHPVLIDFGAAKQNYLVRHSRSQAPYTPGYAAYEQVSSMGETGPWTDIYAIGALMWRMVAGGCPGDSRLSLADESDSGEAESPAWSPTPRAAEKRAYALHTGWPDPMVPAGKLGAERFSLHVLKVIDRCLALYPENRVRDSEELGALLDSADTSATRATLSQSKTSKPKNKPAKGDHGPAAEWVGKTLSGAVRRRLLPKYVGTCIAAVLAGVGIFLTGGTSSMSAGLIRAIVVVALFVFLPASTTAGAQSTLLIADSLILGSITLIVAAAFHWSLGRVAYFRSRRGWITWLVAIGMGTGWEGQYAEYGVQAAAFVAVSNALFAAIFVVPILTSARHAAAGVTAHVFALGITCTSCSVICTAVRWWGGFES